MNYIAFQLPPYSVVIVALVLIVALAFLRKPDKGGALGRAIRNSDWHAWRSAMDDKERELVELRAAEPKGRQ